MKNFTRILICFLVCVFAFGIVGCDRRTPKEKAFTYPNKSDAIYGNGGLSVRKGNYIYFVNGYKSITSSDLTKNTTYNVGSLMLTKLDENGNVVTDETKAIKDDYYISMSNSLVGYEACDLFIHGEYLYFVTPILENEKGDEVWAKERVVFSRIKLDKTSKVETIYESNVKYDSLEYKYYADNNNIFILCYEKGDAYYNGSAKNALVRVNAKNGNVDKVTENASSVILSENASDVFYVYDDKQDDNTTNYDIIRYNVLTNSSSDFIINLAYQPTAQFVGADKVYFTKSHENNSNSYTDLVVSSFEDKQFSLFLSNVKDYEINITRDGSAVILVKDNVMSLVSCLDDYKQTSNGLEIKTTFEEAEDVSINIIDYTNGCILYYVTDSDCSKIKLVSYSNAIQGLNVEAMEVASISSVEEDYTYFDLNEEENYLYFYQTAGKSNTEYYLHRLKVNNNVDEEASLIGVYNKNDIPEIEEETEE